MVGSATSQPGRLILSLEAIRTDEGTRHQRKHSALSDAAFRVNWARKRIL